MHSEFNASDSESAHLLQIWIRPRERDLEPSYEQKVFDANANGAPATQLVASPDGRDGSLTIQQDVSLYRVRLNAGQEWTTDALPTGKACAHRRAVGLEVVVVGVCMAGEPPMHRYGPRSRGGIRLSQRSVHWRASRPVAPVIDAACYTELPVLAAAKK